MKREIVCMCQEVCVVSSVYGQQASYDSLCEHSPHTFQV